MWLLLIFSLVCLFPPFTGIGVAGVVAWGLLSLLFRTADQGVEQMSEAAQSGNTGAAGCWLWAIGLFVVTGGTMTILLALSVAGGLRP